MLLFCPACSNMLVVARAPLTEPGEAFRGRNCFECRTCPYRYVLDRRYAERKVMPRKEVEDIMGGAKAWENVDKTHVQCPNDRCNGGEAFFFQVQIRSADEPMTSFYKCTTCGKQWRE
ncbi:hypothetical protein BDY21DRAFT_65688 [Lineolata rhizophorae]|uniref:DNA-directed RNA polymerase subunit n=1 Tax=Lineolata rhizophorae TaxID=578093 RepID=A0A6A6NW98_9PEZI|nr:hypothetical protein BDY21DRAFT_65688 [Lineolata rhizophorae]